LDLERVLPDVDVFLPTGAHDRLYQLVESWRQRRDGGRQGDGQRGRARFVDGSGSDRFASFENRKLLTPAHTAYVKVAEGCNRRCSFCAIPAIRGRQVTRPVSSIVREVEGLVDAGVKEITLLSQDIVSYRHGRDGLLDLVDRLVDTGIEWIRLFYLHPAGLTLDTLRRLFAHPAVVKYIEMPVQHASDRMLAAMRRSHGRSHVEDLIRGIRAEIPETVVRSEVIVGHPGETDEDFDELSRFVQEIEFDSLGIFPYSPEPGTAAAAADGVVANSIARQRADEIAQIQEAVSFGVQSQRIGRSYRVLVDRKCAPDESAFGFDGTAIHAGRFYGQAPEIDGEVFMASGGFGTGEFVSVEITDCDIFDLKGELLTGSSV
jgi:ribosomal protein S12 methylthiotransferase